MGYECDGMKMVDPGHCGGTTFRTSWLLNYRTCQVVRCTRCGQLRTYPEPAAEDLDLIYNQGKEKYNLADADSPKRRAEGEECFDGMLAEFEQFATAKGRLLDVGCNYG